MTIYYLAHHGTKGQRWGIRRYQNKDGTLTPEGRVHYGVGKKRISRYQYEDGSLTKEGKDYISKVKEEAHFVYNVGKGKRKDAEVEQEKKDLGIKSVDEDTEVVPKGIKLQRVSSGSESLDDKRKYVSILDSDNSLYFWDFGYDLAKDGYNTKIIEYESTKDMKVASYKKTHEELMKFIGDKNISEYTTTYANMFGERLANELLSKYGNTKLKDIDYDPITEKMLRNSKVPTVNKEHDLGNRDRWVENYFDMQTRGVALGSNSVLMSFNDEYKFHEHMKNLGYDAVVDTYDSRPGNGMYSLVVINPKSTLKENREYSALDENAEPVTNKKRR